MPSVISAGTTAGTAIAITGDTTGNLAFQTNGTTTAMTIDTSQNVGIGTSSPSFGLTVQRDNGSGYVAGFRSAAGSPMLTIQNTGGVSQIQGLNSALSATADIALQVSGGNVGIGTSSPSFTSGGGLMVQNGTQANLRLDRFGEGGFELQSVASTLRFYSTAASAERMRIDSSGNLLVGTTSSSQVSGAGIKLNPLSGSPEVNIVGAASTNGNTCYHLFSTGASAYRFYVGYGGTIFATSTSITGISDQRVKENIIDLDDGLDAVMALKPRKFDWKEGKGKGIKGDRGFIAQEFETVFPDMIETWKDPAPEGEEPYKAVNANLIPTLVKAIQELKAELDATKAEVQALKGVA